MQRRFNRADVCGVLEFQSQGFRLCGVVGVWKSSRKKKNSFLQDYFDRAV